MLLHLPTLRSLFFLFLSSPTASLSFLFFPPCTLVVSLSSFHHTESYFCVVITGSRANHKLDLIYAGSALPPTYPSRRPLLSFSFSICSLEGVGAFAREPLLSRSIDYQRGTGGAFLFFFFLLFCFFDSKGIPLCWQWGARDASIDLLEIALLFELCFAVSRKPSISNTQGTLLFSFADDRRTSLFFNPLVLCFF